LTARQHSIEHKAQKVQADKLRLANESDRVYNEYLNALDAKKIQYKAITADGSTTFRDATLAILENGVVPSYSGETSGKTFLIQNASTNEIYVTPEFAAEFGITEGRAESVGTLDEYLTENNCPTTQPTVQVTDYSTINSVTPVQNVITSSPSSTSGSTTYSINGGLSTPTTSSTDGSSSWTSTGSIQVNAQEGTTSSTIAMTNAVEGAVNVSDMNTNVDEKSTYTIENSSYRIYEGADFTYNSLDLDRTIKTLFDEKSWRFSEDYTAHTVWVSYGNKYNSDKLKGNYDNSYEISYDDATSDDSTMTLRQLLEKIAEQNTGISFDEENGILSTDDAIMFRTFSDSGHDADEQFASYLFGGLEDNNQSDRQVYWSEDEYTLGLDTIIGDYLYSSATIINDVDDITFKNLDFVIDGEDKKFSSTMDLSSTTFEDYFSYLRGVYGDDFSYGTNDDGTIYISLNGNHTISSAGLAGDYAHTKTTTNSQDITYNPTAIAENIYLAYSMLNSTSENDYNSNHDASISDIKNEINTKYLNEGSLGARQLVLFNEQLSEAMATGDATKINEVLNKFGQAIDSDKYIDSNGVDDDGYDVTTIYNFNMADSAISVSPNTSSSTNNGTLTVPSNSDLEEYLAYKLYSNYSGSYSDYLTSIQQTGYNAYQLAELYEQFDSYKEGLKNGTDLRSSLTAYTDSTYNLSQSENDTFSVTDTSTSGTSSVTVAGKDDIVKRLAYDVYAAQGSTGNPNDLISSISALFSTDKEYASISSYYGTNQWNEIVSKIVSNSDIDEYKHVYDNYDSVNFRANTLSISTNTTDGTSQNGQMNIPKIEQIASNLVVALRKAGYSVDNENEITTLLERIYSDDNASNNKTLANINQALCNYLTNGTNSGEISNIYNHLTTGSALNITTIDNIDNYDITRKNLGACQVSYGTTTQNSGDEVWDTSSDEYNELVARYATLKALEGYSFVVVSNELAHSTDFVSNFLALNEGVLIEFDNQYAIQDMPKTSVSVETSLQEVSDETDLKKAEAKYEADMNRINKKDTRYDNELAKFETERTAVKDEIETLQTVAKENVERTFKLFS
jgi:hypothetical protein